MRYQVNRALRSLIAGVAALAAGAALIPSAMAVPALQLDIIGGTYDQSSQSIVIDSDQFTVVALATPMGSLSESDILSPTEDFFLSIALMPPPDESPSFNTGSFTVNGDVIDANDASLHFGTPPVGADHTLAGHGVFPTYYAEIAFRFDDDDTTTTYNSQDNPGGTLTNGTGSYYATFEIDMAGILGYQLHFDLYDIQVKHGNIWVDHFAPFSHDAESGGGEDDVPEEDIPEPAGIGLLLVGLIGMGWARRRLHSAA